MRAKRLVATTCASTGNLNWRHELQTLHRAIFWSQPFLVPTTSMMARSKLTLQSAGQHICNALTGLKLHANDPEGQPAPCFQIGTYFVFFPIKPTLYMISTAGWGLGFLGCLHGMFGPWFEHIQGYGVRCFLPEFQGRLEIHMATLFVKPLYYKRGGWCFGQMEVLPPTAC